MRLTSKKVRRFSKNDGLFWENLPRNFENLPRFLENVGSFFSNDAKTISQDEEDDFARWRRNHRSLAKKSLISCEEYAHLSCDTPIYTNNRDK